MPLFLAIKVTASIKVRFSFSMMKVMPSPPRLQLKQWNRFLPGVTANEPVRSWWKGQSPISVRPFRESLTYGLRTSSMARFLTLLMVDSLIIPFWEGSNILWLIAPSIWGDWGSGDWAVWCSHYPCIYGVSCGLRPVPHTCVWLNRHLPGRMLALIPSFVGTLLFLFQIKSNHIIVYLFCFFLLLPVFSFDGGSM